LRGYDLVGFIDGSLHPPSPTIVHNEITSVNPAFSKWHQQDQLILAWLFSSISALILVQILNVESSFQLWQRIQQFHTYQSLAKVLELKMLLQTSKKVALSCTQFVQHMQSIAYRLRSVGSTISDQDLVIYTLQGLGFEYEIFITTFSIHD
jgi:gag-polypeptide of LTR copia-type